MSKVVSWIFDHMWGITEEALETIIALAERDRVELSSILAGKQQVDTEALSIRLGEPVEGTAQATIRNGSAIIPIVGPIFPRANLLTQMSGATSIQTVASDFSAVMKNPDVKRVILDIDSPGGEVTGISEFANMIHSSREKKPITAYIDGKGASAAYWLASAADEVVISETAVLGSIGIIAALKDTRRADDAAGVKKIEFVSSVSPNKRVNFDSEESLKKIQTVVDNLGGVMVQSIARNRGTDEETVLADFGKGGLLVGALAVGQGLADRIGSLEELIDVPRSKSHSNVKGAVMDVKTLKAEHPDVYQAIIDEGKAQAQAANAEEVRAAEERGAENENQRIKAIEEIKTPGAEAIVAEHKFNRKETKETISAKVLASQDESRAAAAAAHGKDADKLGQDAAGAGNLIGEGSDEEMATAAAAIAKGINGGE
jgi:ClpP class serine protease